MFPLILGAMLLAASTPAFAPNFGPNFGPAVAPAVAPASVLPAVDNPTATSVVRIEGSTLRFIAAAGTTNRVTIGVHPSIAGWYRLTDGSALAASGGCTADGSVNAVRCPAASFANIRVDLGDLADSAVNRTTRPSALYGGTGNDTLTGNRAADRLDGGPGDDRMDGGLGNDVFIGGPGIDTADYSLRTAAVTVDLTTARGGQSGETDVLNITAANGIEDVISGIGNDRLTGNEWANRLDGGEGNNTFDGKDGADVLFGHRGDDDGFGGSGDDILIGGPGRDQLAGNGGDDFISGEGGTDIGNGGANDDFCTSSTETQLSC